MNKEEENAAESLLLREDVLDDSELILNSVSEEKASTLRKQDRDKKWSKEDKMVITKLFRLSQYKAGTFLIQLHFARIKPSWKKGIIRFRSSLTSAIVIAGNSVSSQFFSQFYKMFQSLNCWVIVSI